MLARRTSFMIERKAVSGHVHEAAVVAAFEVDVGLLVEALVDERIDCVGLG